MEFFRAQKRMNYVHDQYYNRKPVQSFKSYKNRSSYRLKSKKGPSRPQSPTVGSQEYMDKKIEQTSAIIMRQLLNPNEVPPVQTNAAKQIEENIPPNRSSIQESEQEKSLDSQTSASKNKKKLSHQEVEEIHSKIMYHLTNLNDGRKRNLINSQNSGYDSTIQHFVKQQRLEISRALRSMCSSNQREDQSEIINSIIPDIGIKIEDLPRDVIEELSHTFGDDFNLNIGAYNNFSYMNDNVPIPGKIMYN